MKVIYMDNNATTQCSPAVVEAMLPYFSEKYGNASSMHAFGGNNRHAIDAARKSTAELIGAAYPDEIIFTSCATESDNTAIFSAVRTQPKKKHLITSAVEHPAIMEPYKYLESQGYRIDFIGVDEFGRFDMERFKSVIDEDTARVSVMWANSETGTSFPVAEIPRIAHEHGACFIRIGAAPWQIPVDVKAAGIVMLSLSAQISRPKRGRSAVTSRRGTRFMAFMLCGQQEKPVAPAPKPCLISWGLGKAAN
jgi:cysteine desulfurase